MKSVATRIQHIISLRQRNTALKLMNAGANTDQLLEVLVRKGVTIDASLDSDPNAARYRMADHQLFAFLDRLRKERAHEYDSLRDVHKTEQVSRVQYDLVRMRSMVNPPWSSIVRHEDLLARLLGTLTPTRVEVFGHVEIREAVVACISKMTDSDLDALVAEQVDLEKRAEAN